MRLSPSPSCAAPAASAKQHWRSPMRTAAARTSESIWRIRARTDSTIRADLADLAVARSWNAPKSSDAEATNAALSRLEQEGKGFLLIYDDAADSDLVRRYLPSRGGAKAIVIFDPHRGDFGQSIELSPWPKSIGSKFLLAHASTGRLAEAETLSAALGGLPLAHAQAAAYCAQLGVSLAEYRRRLERTTTRQSPEGEPSESGENQIIARTFALSVGEAERRHPAAARLMEHVALLAAEPIPLFFFNEGRLPLMPAVEAGMKRSRVLRRWSDGLWRVFKRYSRKAKRPGDGPRPFFRPISAEDLDSAIRALTDFALADRMLIADQRDPKRLVPALVLPRLTRNAAANYASGKGEAELIKVMLSVYPEKSRRRAMAARAVARLFRLDADLRCYSGRWRGKRGEPVAGQNSALPSILAQGS